MNLPTRIQRSDLSVINPQRSEAGDVRKILNLPAQAWLVCRPEIDSHGTECDDIAQQPAGICLVMSAEKRPQAADFDSFAGSPRMIIALIEVERVTEQIE